MRDYMDDDEINRVCEIVSQLPDEDRMLVERYQEMVRANSMQYVAAAIMMRNFSHNIGTHCLESVTSDA